MTDNFTQTVNLREKMEKERAAMLSRVANNERAPADPAPEPAKKPKPAPPRKPEKAVLRRPEKRKADEIDEIYKEESRHDRPDDNLRTISRPEIRRVNESLTRRVVVVLAVIIALSAVYFLVFRDGSGAERTSPAASEPKWYMVKLINGETYYGRIGDTGADPVVLEIVYYNYDQLNPGEAKTEEGGNLKLVKRGKEAHGPEGTMDIVRAQVVYMEPLKEDSKVLKAIVDNENK